MGEVLESRIGLDATVFHSRGFWSALRGVLCIATYRPDMHE